MNRNFVPNFLASANWRDLSKEQKKQFVDTAQEKSARDSVLSADISSFYNEEDVPDSFYFKEKMTEMQEIKEYRFSIKDSAFGNLNLSKD